MFSSGWRGSSTERTALSGIKSSWEHRVKEVWWKESAPRVMDVLANEVEAAVRALPPDSCQHPASWTGTTRLFETLVLQVLGEREPSLDDVRQGIALSLRSLRGEPVAVSVRADLVGIAVLTSPVEFEEAGRRIRLRAPERADMEEEQPIEWVELAQIRHQLRSSAILEIDIKQPMLPVVSENSTVLLQYCGSSALVRSHTPLPVQLRVASQRS